MATQWNNQVTEKEFEFPQLIDPLTVNLVKLLRLEINKPFWFSKHRHPGGDARPWNDGNHYSLHYTGIDHENSAIQKRAIPNNKFLCRALDFSVDCYDPVDFLNIATAIDHILVDVSPASGFGIYPNWNHPGFHVDTRKGHHPSAGARWYTIKVDDRQEYQTIQPGSFYSSLLNIEDEFNQWHS